MGSLIRTRTCSFNAEATRNSRMHHVGLEAYISITFYLLYSFEALFQALHHHWSSIILTCLVALYIACLDTYVVGFSLHDSTTEFVADACMPPRNLIVHEPLNLPLPLLCLLQCMSACIFHV